MLDITPLKVLVILVVALVALGPERLPRLAYQVARAWGDMQRFRHQLGSEVRDTVLGESAARSTPTSASEPVSTMRRDEAPSEMMGTSGEEPDGHHPGLN